ncbi:MAG: hypothetical protein CL959_01405 [Euryarchaeota archaeon]|nr:hypothetical protein [Euryarchaeota archaeon]|tara:strand:+ start:681 stop:920 length:240 start_codon:yes stop_codon:yes gene_type:complete
MSIDQILRIVFRSGRVVEERGNDEMVQLLFAGDELDLIDHVMSIDLRTGQVHLYTDEDDDRFNDVAVLMSGDAIKWFRR